MRFAYDVLSKKWKEQLFKQNFYARLMGNDKIPDSIKNEMVGRKPPFSVFMKVMNGVSNPVKVISESTPVEFITFVDENLESMGNKIFVAWNCSKHSKRANYRWRKHPVRPNSNRMTKARRR